MQGDDCEMTRPVLSVRHDLTTSCGDSVTHRSNKAEARRVAPVIRVGAVVHYNLAASGSGSFDFVQELICNALQRGVELGFAVKAATPRVCDVLWNLPFLRR